jgi:hypothetical protein
LTFTANGHAQAERVLQTALDAAVNPPDAWRAEATSLLVVAMAGQPLRVNEAKTLLRTAAGSSPQSLWEMTQSLARLLDEAPPSSRSSLANLVLEACDLLGPVMPQLAAADQVSAQRIRAESLAAADKFHEARQLYEQLAKQHPRDGQIQQGYGELLLASDDPALRPAALRQWRIIAQGSRPRTERWWQAKYNVALLLYESGEREQAAQLIRYLQEVPPGLDDSPLKQDFLDLLKRSQ